MQFDAWQCRGPTMEQVYEGMDGFGDPSHAGNSSYQKEFNKIRKQDRASKTTASTLSTNVAANSVSKEFHKLKNPEIRLYVYPHLAGQDQVPIPGYFTVFTVYEHDYYALPQE